MSDFDRIRILYCDHLNLARGKYLPIEIAQSGQARCSVGVYAVGYDRVMVDAPGAMMHEGLPDLEAVFDAGAAREGWEPRTGVVIADLERGGEPLALDGRGFLKRTIAEWEEVGGSPTTGIELEAYVFQRDEDGQWVPYHTPGAFVYGTGTATDPEGLIEDVWQQALRCGFKVEAINSEYDWPQFEFTMRYDSALRAVDDVFLFRLMAREMLARRGYLMTFMPKPFSDRGGNGLHVNFSFSDKDGNNVLNDPASEDGLSELAKGCIAGLVEHHEALTAILAPTVNSYRRLRPAQLAGYWANWGYDHRGATVRIPAERGRATRVEHRLGDAAANPYIAVGSVLQAALLGVKGKYPLPPHETGDGLDTVNTDRHAPEDLGSALDALQADEVLTNAIGAPIVDHFVAIKRKEFNDYLGHTTDWELNAYLEFL